jgi:serine/threonine protein kinase
MSPELIRGTAYSFGVDVWALGVVVFIILGGYTPFFGDDDSQCEHKVLLGSFEFHPDYWGNVSEEAKDLIRKMLTVDPKQRISLADAIQHPWLTRCPKDQLAANDITANVTNLKNFQAQRKLKGAARAIMAVNRLSGGGGISELLRKSLSGVALDKLVNSAVAKSGGKDS